MTLFRAPPGRGLSATLLNGEQWLRRRYSAASNGQAMIEQSLRRAIVPRAMVASRYSAASKWGMGR